MKTAAACAATVVVVLAILTIGMVSGIYNFAADAPHTTIVANAIEFARDRSVEVRASGIKVPPLNNSAMIAEGAEHYDGMCTGCHLAPGMRENEMRPGLYPKPPILAAQPPDDPEEQFWIVKHGLKMSGMPAWGLTHPDPEIWKIVAFLQKLPGMSDKQYRGLMQEAHAHHEHIDE
jgi:mono/diheme cytochrome c family protein